MTAATRSADAATASVAERALTALRASGLSQAEAARHIGIDKTKLSKSLSGARRFRIEELAAIAELTGVSLDWLSRCSEATAGGEERPVPRPRAQAGQAPAAAVPGSSPAAQPSPSDPAPNPAPNPAANPATASGAGQASAKALRMRTRIADAAWRLFSTWGYHRVRMIDIAERAGISAAGLHYHYTSKQEVFVAALRHSADRLDRERADVLASLTPADLDDVAAHQALLHALIELKVPRDFTKAQRTPADEALAGDWSIWLQNCAEIAVGAGSREQAAALATAWNAVFAAVLAAGQAAGAFIAADPAEAAARLTIFLDGLVLRALAGAADDPTALIDDYLAAAILAPGLTSRQPRSKGEPAP